MVLGMVTSLPTFAREKDSQESDMHRLWWKLDNGWTEGKEKKTLLLFSP